ncbi:hypothetical protein BH09PAT4_BH09PAT4_01290 [soil metagenome]|jgi:hypothetical protein
MKPTRALFKQSREQRHINAHRSLLRHLAKLGGSVFGVVPNGVRREFFCLDDRTWVWHEEWYDQAGQHHAITTRYDVRPDGILKSQGVNSYQRLSAEEERNFRAAVEIYGQRSLAELQRLRQQIA